MSNTPFMPLWVADFVGDTLDLDAKEIGAYMLILMTMWGRDGYLPSDEKKLQRVARCGRDWPRVWASLSHYFTVDGDRITQGRLLLELQKVAAKREVNAQHGSLGGKAKALKGKEPTLANATVSLQQPEPEPYREDTEAKASDASVDFAKQLWDRGVAFLGRHGTQDKQARTLIGKWRKAYTDTDIFEAFSACSKEGIIDPVPWITAKLAGKDKPNGKSSRGEKFLRSFVAGASVAPRVDFGEDCDPSQPLLARG